jgi:hypothetical protein
MEWGGVGREGFEAGEERRARGRGEAVVMCELKERMRTDVDVPSFRLTRRSELQR